jgi:hypothetical protein
VEHLGFKSKLSEFWNGEPVKEVKQPTAKIIKSDFSKERPEHVTFERLIRYHDMTPQIQVAVGSYSELITGTDLIVQSENQEATDFINEWMRRINFYEKFESVVTTALICGTALLEKLSASHIEDVEEVDMTTIVSKKRSDVGELEYYEQRQLSGRVVRLENIEDFIEFRINNYSKQAWGRSIFYSLAIPRTTGYRTTAPLVEVMWGSEDAMGGIIQNNAYPITTITYPGANDDYLEKEAERWRRYKPGDKRVQKIKPEIDFFETNPASKYTDYIQHLEKTMELGTQFPHDILTGDFTSRASSETTETIVMKKVRGWQRYFCSVLKRELFEPLLEQNGFNTEEVKLELSFTTQNVIELEPDKVIQLFSQGVITLEEVRDWFQENTGMDMDESQLKALVDKKEEEEQKEQDKFEKGITAKQKTDENLKQKLKEQDEVIAKLKESVMEREAAEKYDRVKLTKEIIEEIKNL